MQSMRHLKQKVSCLPLQCRSFVDGLLASHSTDLQQRAYELQTFLGLNPDIVQKVLPVNGSGEDIMVCTSLILKSHFSSHVSHLGDRIPPWFCMLLGKNEYWSYKNRLVSLQIDSELPFLQGFIESALVNGAPAEMHENERLNNSNGSFLSTTRSPK